MRFDIDADFFPLKVLADEYGTMQYADAHAAAKIEFAEVTDLEGATDDQIDMAFRLMTVCARHNYNVANHKAITSVTPSFSNQMDYIGRRICGLDSDRKPVIMKRIALRPKNIWTPEWLFYVDWLTFMIAGLVPRQEIRWRSLIGDAMRGDTEKWIDAFFNGVPGEGSIDESR